MKKHEIPERESSLLLATHYQTCLDISDFCSRGFNCLLDDSQTLTLFPVPLPTGGWHSQACLTAHSMISTRAVSWRSVRARNRRNWMLPTTCPIDWELGEAILHRSKMMLWTKFLQLVLEQKYELVLRNMNQYSLTFLSWHGLIQQQTDHRFPVL